MNRREFEKYLSERLPEGCHITIADAPEYTQEDADELIAFIEKVKNAPPDGGAQF